jgi:molecular chaperone DnaK
MRIRVSAPHRLGIDDFDDVLLVGGATRMPAVGRALKERFGFEPRVHDPDLAVAKGAARFALIESVKLILPDADTGGTAATASNAALDQVASQLGLTRERVEELAATKITTVVPRAFGIKVIDSDDPKLEREFVDHLLSANTALPADTGAQAFATVVPNQTEIKIEVWEQAGAVASPELEHNTLIGEGLISQLPPLPARSPVDVTFIMDELGTLRVHAVERSTRRDLHIELQIGGLDETEVAEARNAVARYTLSE